MRSLEFFLSAGLAGLWMVVDAQFTLAQSVITQAAPAEMAEISEVQLSPAGEGLIVVLLAEQVRGAKVSQQRTPTGLILELDGAVLASSFQQDNPAAGVDALEVKQVGDRRVQIIIIAPNQSITSRLQRSTGKFTFNLSLEPVPVAQSASEPALAEQPAEPELAPAPSPSSESAPLPASEGVRINITGDDDADQYRVPTATAGTRTDTPLEDVPQSIQVIPKRILEEQGAATLGESLRNVSGATTGDIAAERGATSLILRGFESNNILRNGLRDQTTRFNAGSTNIERIEVLKGPASVLFGAGDLGGTVSIVTEEPLDEPQYEFELSADQYGSYRPSIDFTGPLTNDGALSYRLNASYENKERFQDFSETETYFFSPVIKVLETDRTNLILELEYLKERFEGGSTELPAVGTVISSPFGKVDIDENLGEPSLEEGEATQIRIGYRLSHELGNNWLIKNELLASFQNSPNSVGVTPTRLLDDGRTLQRVYTDNPSSFNNYTFNTSLLGQLFTGDVEHKLLIGLERAVEKSEDLIEFRSIRSNIDIFDPEYGPDSLFPSLDSPLTPFILQDADSEVKSWGFYLQDQISFSDQFILVLGGRLDIVDQDFQDVANPSFPTDFESQDSVFSPRIGLVYKPWPNLSLYGGYSKSFIPTLGQECDRADDGSCQVDPSTGAELGGSVLGPERGQQFEVGAKASLFDERLSATLSYYRLVRNDFKTNDPNSIRNFQTQIGEQVSQGVELDLVGELAPGWQLIGSYAYTDATVTKDDVVDEGNRLPNVPIHAASLWTTYTLQAGELRGLGLGLGMNYEGEREGVLDNSFDLPGYTRWDAALFYERDRFRAQLNFNNIFNKRYFQGARNDVRVIPGAPFDVKGSISWRF
ncbi:MAG: TonB-dependent siderophore receptor [Synechococcales cyanobacterium RM1_1_8]|nr:TonB-dependent siderophore receptor [Synechococcales cyanobacterium RM1_1_8]